MRLAGIFGFMVGATAVMLPLAAQAFDDHSTQYGISDQPLYKVGTHNSPLSLLCRQGKFNEVRINYYYMTFTNPEWGGAVGIAKKNFNLYDPEQKAIPTETYFFYQDGTSECAVYLAKDRG